MPEKNEGWAVLNFPKHKMDEDEFTIVVSGLGRSGTSMIGKMLSLGGIPMGVAKADTIHEDVGLSHAVEIQDEEVIRRVVEIRNSKFKRWGFKRPLIVRRDGLLEAHLRSPRYVLIFRDPLAVAMRNRLSLGISIPDGLAIFNQQFAELNCFVSRNQSPKLLVSYEKALQDPAEFTTVLARFCGIARSKVPAMMQAIKPNDEAYLAAARGKLVATS